MLIPDDGSSVLANAGASPDDRENVGIRQVGSRARSNYAAGCLASRLAPVIQVFRWSRQAKGLYWDKSKHPAWNRG